MIRCVCFYDTLAGSIYHKDNMGNESKISSGDIQVLSAGTGIYHSEFNANNTHGAGRF